MGAKENLEEVAVKHKKSNALSVVKGEELMIIDEEVAKMKLEELVSLYDGMEITEENLKDGKEARKIVRQHRFDLQNITKRNVTVIENAKKHMKSGTDGLIEIISPVEKHLDDQIKAIEEKKEREKKEAKEAEEKRIKEIQHKINDYRERLEKLVAVGNTKSQQLEFTGIIADLQEKKHLLDEFEFEGQELIDDFTEKGTEITKRIQEKQDLEEQKQKQAKEKERLEKEAREMKETLLELHGFEKNESESAYIKRGYILCDIKDFDTIPLPQLKEDIETINREIEEADALAKTVEELAKKLKERKQKIDVRSVKLIEAGFEKQDNGDFVKEGATTLTSVNIVEFTDEQIDEHITKAEDEVKLHEEKLKQDQEKRDAIRNEYGPHVETVAQLIQEAGEVDGLGTSEDEYIIEAYSRFVRSISMATDQLRKDLHFFGEDQNELLRVQNVLVKEFGVNAETAFKTIESGD